MSVRSIARLLVSIAPLLLLVSALGGCVASHSSIVAVDSIADSSAADIAGLAGLPSPEAILAMRQASYCDSELVRLGSEYEVAIPNDRIATLGGQLRLNPGWKGLGLDGAAYCGYDFNVPGFDLASEVQFDWDSVPQGESGLYIGFSRWATNSWDWHEYGGGGTLAVSNMAEYFNANDDLLLVLVSIGTEPWILNSLRLGPEPGFTTWHHAWGMNDTFVARDVAVDPKGSVFVVSRMNGTLAAYYDCALLKFDALGNYCWAKYWGNEDRDECTGVAASPGGDIFICGFTKMSLEDDYDVLVQRWTQEGELVWSSKWGTGEDDKAAKLKVTNDALYVTGFTDAVGISGQDILVLKYSYDGTLLNAAAYGGGFADEGIDLAVSAPPTGDPQIHLVAKQGISESDHVLLYLQLDDNLSPQQSLMWLNAPFQIEPTGIEVTSDATPRVYLCGDADDKLVLLEALDGGTPVARVIAEPGEVSSKAAIADMPGQGLALSCMCGDPGALMAMGGLVHLTYEGEFVDAIGLHSEGNTLEFCRVEFLAPDRLAFCGNTYQCWAADWISTSFTSSALDGNWTSTLTGYVTMDEPASEMPFEVNSVESYHLDTGEDGEILLGVKLLD